jgi:hypothetical protein
MRRATNTINYGGTLPFARCERTFRSEGYALHTHDRAVRRRCRASDPWRATSSVRTGRKTESEAVANHPRRRGVPCAERPVAVNWSSARYTYFVGSVSRHRIAAHLGDRIPAQSENPRRLAPALPVESPHKFQPQTSRPPSESPEKVSPKKWPGFTPQPQNAAAPWPTIAPPRQSRADLD